MQPNDNNVTASISTPVNPGGDVVFKDKSQKSKGMIVGMIVLALLAIGGVGFGVWAYLDGNARVAEKDEQIASMGKGTAEQVLVKENDNDEETPLNLDGIYYLYDDSVSKDQRYRLMIVDGGSDAVMEKNSEDDEYYVLDMNNVGKNGSVRKVELVSLLKPLTDDVIANNLPETSVNAIGEITNKSQCESFSLTYYDPRSDLPGGGTEGWDLSSELPLKVSFFCHKNNNTEQVKYYDLVYILNVESNEVRQHFLEGKNNFKL